MIKKITKLIFGMVLCVFISCAGVFIHAMNNDNIDSKIRHAQVILAQAQKELSEKDPEKFFIYTQNPFSVDGHLAELELREKYPAEYSRYISAKLDLDDLLYLQFVIMANQIDKDE